MVFMYIGIAVVIFIIIFNITERSVNKPKHKPNVNVKGVTVNSIEKVMDKQKRAMDELQKISEDRLFRVLTLGIEKASDEIKDNPNLLEKLMQALIDNQKKELIRTAFATTNRNIILSDSQINHSIEQAVLKVSNHVNKLNNE